MEDGHGHGHGHGRRFEVHSSWIRARCSVTVSVTVSELPPGPFFRSASCCCYNPADTMTTKRHIFISAAERSGDAHASRLVREILRRNEGVSFSGFGGDLLAEAGCDLVEETSGRASIGVGYRWGQKRFNRD